MHAIRSQRHAWGIRLSATKLKSRKKSIGKSSRWWSSIPSNKIVIQQRTQWHRCAGLNHSVPIHIMLLCLASSRATCNLVRDRLRNARRARSVEESLSKLSLLASRTLLCRIGVDLPGFFKMEGPGLPAELLLCTVLPELLLRF